MHKISGRTRRTTKYASVLWRTRNLCKTYAERVQRTPTYGQNASYVGIRWRYTLWCEHPFKEYHNYFEKPLTNKHLMPENICCFFFQRTYNDDDDDDDDFYLLQVIWRKASQPTPLTIGELTYVPDDRFKLHHIPDKGEWNLFIKNIQPHDAGMYECQISSKEKYIRKLIQVNVIGKNICVTETCPCNTQWMFSAIKN